MFPAMKRLMLLFLLGTVVGLAEEITLTRPAIFKAERTIVSLKAGAVVELLARDEKKLTVRYNKLTGTIPASSLAAGESPKTDAPKSSTPPTPPPPAPPRKAESMYGKMVEKARDNIAKHDKNMTDPTNEAMGGN